jgi:hypothetical protein
MGAAASTPSVTIASGQSLSGQFYVGHGRLVSIEIPSNWTTASITFQASYDGVNFDEVYDYEGNEVEMTVGAGELTPIGNTPYFEGALWMKIRSGTVGSPVDQTDAVTIAVLVRKFPIAKMS